MANRWKIVIYTLAVFLIGAVFGGYISRHTEPRPILTLNKCNQTCLNSSEILGLLSSIGIQNFKGLLPGVIKETDKTIALQSPFPQAKIHYIIIPKKDIRDIGSISQSDSEYIADIFRVIAAIVNERHLLKYKVITNGPGYQDVNYLHFQLLAN